MGFERAGLRFQNKLLDRWFGTGLDIPGYALSGLQKYQLPISYNSALKLTFEISMQKDKRNGLTSVFVVF